MRKISCKEAVEYILKKEEGKLTLMQRVSLWRHLTICSLCRIFSAQNKLINESAKVERTGQPKLSQQQKEEIVRNILDGDK